MRQGIMTWPQSSSAAKQTVSRKAVLTLEILYDRAGWTFTSTLRCNACEQRQNYTHSRRESMWGTPKQSSQPPASSWRRDRYFHRYTGITRTVCTGVLSSHAAACDIMSHISSFRAAGNIVTC